jgi:hypothetical protein
MFGTVGRATVPAETGRHGGRSYDSTRPKFLFRIDWKLFRPLAGPIPAYGVEAEGEDSNL